jgi:7-cyano-7-deazaguanine tRNA-ribosyltransferase
MVQFEIRTRDGLARLGRLTTNHGTVRTPLLMPVVHPGKSSIRPTDLVKEFGFQMVITNSYIIRSHDRFREKALKDGVHGLLDFDGPIMTDSGTFQMYFHDLPQEEIDPLQILEFQKSIKTDIGTILDAFSDPDVAKTQVESDVSLSLERARVSAGKKGDMMLAGTIQGGIYPDLRERSAIAMAPLDFDVHPIGGVVPLMERYRYTDIVRATMAAKKHLPPNRPVHLFGCGHPMFFAQAAYLGCDFFDSASYAKFAEAGRMLLPTGTVHLEQLSELPCSCPVCSSITAAELKSLPKEKRDLNLMRHNLYVSAEEMRNVRNAIADGKLFELVAQRARNHPSLLDALHSMTEYAGQIASADMVGKTSSILYTGPETHSRPEIVQFHSRLRERWPYRQARTILAISDEARRPFADSIGTIIEEVKMHPANDVQLLIVTPMGVVPWELEHVHPAQQCIFPATIEGASIARSLQKLEDLISLIAHEEVVWFDRQGAQSTPKVELAWIDSRAESASDMIKHVEQTRRESKGWMRRKLKAVLAIQWGEDCSRIADLERLSIELSKGTGKIRHVKFNDEIVFTLIPTTGLLAPTFLGGGLLLENGIDSQYIVQIDDEVADFVADGKSALAKFIRHADPNLRAGEEVLVVDSKNDLLGVGRAILNGTEMLAFDRGVAVNTRHSRKS